MDIFEKCAKATEYESGLKESGYYFFFRKLESPQDSEVVVNGKRTILAGLVLFFCRDFDFFTASLYEGGEAICG